MTPDRTPPLPGWLPWLILVTFIVAGALVAHARTVELRDEQRRADTDDWVEWADHMTNQGNDA